jgi:hypothetical protein
MACTRPSQPFLSHFKPVDRRQAEHCMIEDLIAIVCEVTGNRPPPAILSILQASTRPYTFEAFRLALESRKPGKNSSLASFEEGRKG